MSRVFRYAQSQRPRAGRWSGKRTASGPLRRTIGRMADPSLFLVAECWMVAVKAWFERSSLPP